MGAYSNFVQDLPNRCNSLLRDFEVAAKYRGKEVTLMLAMATSGLIIPFARLQEPKHPSLDRSRFIDAMARFNDLMSTRFLGSRLWPSNSASWTVGKVDCGTQQIDVWSLESKSKPLSNEEVTSKIVRRLRNALAHGNIFTLGNPISRLIFLSQLKRDGDEFIFYMVSPVDFRSFLSNWFLVLETLKIPGEVPTAGELVSVA
jgi:hypothetical protein